ncbi:MAG: VWA domain-containing protein, partial [Bryobacteraceae bacterium]
MNTCVPRHLARGFAVAVAVFVSAPIASPQSAAPSTENQNEVRFKAETDLVLVPVVVRDDQGNAVGNLRKVDFQIFDKGKPQEITKFSIEDTSGHVAADRSLPGGDTPAAGKAEAAAMTIPEHFVALLFDDLHMKNGPGNIGDFGDLVYSRDAALKFLDTLQPADRMAIFTTSGEVMLDFTFDRAKLKAALLKIRAAPPNPAMGASACQIQREIENESRAVVMQSGDIVRRMARLAGQRTVVLISSGLILYNQGLCGWSLVPETMQLIGNAVRSHVVFNGLDARGLDPISSGFSYQMFQAQMTDGTGGRFIADTNDLKGAIRQLGATPKYIYVLGFSPQVLKPDGSF